MLLSDPAPQAIVAIVQAPPHLIGLPLVVQREQPAQHLPSRLVADCETYPLFGLVTAVAEIEIGPTVGKRHSAVHIYVKLAE